MQKVSKNKTEIRKPAENDNKICFRRCNSLLEIDFQSKFT